MLELGCRQNMTGMETKRARGKCIANALVCQLCWAFLCISEDVIFNTTESFNILLFFWIYGWNISMCTISQRIHEILQKNKFSKRQPDAILNSAAETAQLANQKMADLAAGSAVMPSSPRREVDTADHTHASVVITNPRRRSLTKLIIFELQQTQIMWYNTTKITATKMALLYTTSQNHRQNQSHQNNHATNFCEYLCQILTDLKNSFTSAFS